MVFVGSLVVFVLHRIGTPPPSSPAPSGDISQLPLRPEETWVELLTPERLQPFTGRAALGPVDPRPPVTSGFHGNGLPEGVLLSQCQLPHKDATVAISLP